MSNISLDIVLKVSNPTRFWANRLNNIIRNELDKEYLMSMQMNCHQISESEFKCTKKEYQDQAKSSYNVQSEAGVGIILALGLITAGILLPITSVKGTYKNLTAIDERGNSKWSRLNTYDKLKSVAEPLLMTGAGLLTFTGGVVWGYHSLFTGPGYNN